MNTIGHNNPPIVDIEPITSRLETNNAELLSRKDQLLARAAESPNFIADGDDDGAGLLGNLIRDIAAANKDAEARRVGEKEPILKAGNLVDGFFKARIMNPLATAHGERSRVLTSFSVRKAAAARAKLEAEAARLRAEEDARRKAAEAAAAAIQNEVDLRRAVAAEKVVAQSAAITVKAERAAAAPPADLARARTDTGTLMSLRKETVVEITDTTGVDLNTLRPYFKVDHIESAIRLAVRQGVKNIPGVNVYEKEVSFVK